MSHEFLTEEEIKEEIQQHREEITRLEYQLRILQQEWEI